MFEKKTYIWKQQKKVNIEKPTDHFQYLYLCLFCLAHLMMLINKRQITVFKSLCNIKYNQPDIDNGVIHYAKLRTTNKIMNISSENKNTRRITTMNLNLHLPLFLVAAETKFRDVYTLVLNIFNFRFFDTCYNRLSSFGAFCYKLLITNKQKNKKQNKTQKQKNKQSQQNYLTCST